MQKESLEIENQLTAMESEKSMMQHLIEKSQRELVDLVGTWRKANSTARRELQTSLFPDGLVWGHENGFLNWKNEALMRELSEMIQSLADSGGTAEEFVVRFGVPDGI